MKTPTKPMLFCLLVLAMLLFGPKISAAGPYTFYQYDQTTLPPSLNNNGQIAYVGSDLNVYLYDHNTRTKTQVTYGGGNYSPSINDNGQIVWLHADSSNGPATVRMWNSGTISDVASSLWSSNTFINNNGQVTFNAPTGFENYQGVYLWDNGQSNLLTPVNKGSSTMGINNRGDVTYLMSMGGSYHSEAFIIYSSGSTVQISDAVAEGQPYLQACPVGINDLGNAIYSGNNRNLYFFNGTSSTQITSDLYTYAGSINNADQVVFTEIGGPFFVTLYDSGSLERIIGGIGWVHPDINDQGWIAWEGTLAVPGPAPVPLPPSLLLLAPGLAGMLVARRRFKA